MIPREVVEEVIARSDIEQVIGSYVTLKRAGSNLVGICPFHNEKSPSFTVFQHDQSPHFYCFGCGAGGDVVTFIRKIENLDYVAAVEFLAARAGIEIPHDGKTDRDAVSRKRVLEMNRAAALFFHKCLYDPRYGSEALEYLSGKRALSGATIKHFGLGYSPNDFGVLTSYLHGLGYTDEEMTAGFMCGRSRTTNKLYDYFRNRVMFPIIDVAGNVVAFGGRVMDDSKPKYLNTSDTPAFKKSRNLFALNFAKSHCAEKMILCEGYMDVIALHAAGFENAVATLGTAITEEHARIMAKYTKEVIICYDSDEAGINAANKAMRVLGGVGVEVRVLRVEGAKDPDEFIKKYGGAKFSLLIDKSRTGFEFKSEAVLAKYDINDQQGRLRAAEELVRIISDYYSNVEREIYIFRAAERLSLPADVIKRDVERERARRKKEHSAELSRTAVASIRDFGDRVNPDAAKNPRAAAAEETIIGLLLIDDAHRKAAATGALGLDADDFFTDFGKRAFTEICRLYKSEHGFDFSMLGENFTADEMSRLERCRKRREQLSENGAGVLEAAAGVLLRDRGKRGGDGSLSGDLEAKRRALAAAKDKTPKNGNN